MYVAPLEVAEETDRESNEKEADGQDRAFPSGDVLLPIPPASTCAVVAL